MDDIFCRIINGEIPCHKVYEDEDVLAFLDISQATKGHTLVVPKRHCKNALDCPSGILAKVFAVAQRIANATIEALGAKGVNILTNAGSEAGQTVMHFHVHVLPRYGSEDEGLTLAFNEHEVNSATLPELAQQIGNFVK